MNLEELYKNNYISNLNNSFQHPPYILEKKLVRLIQQKDEKGCVSVLEQINCLERANLADLPIRSLKNSIICSCTIFTRAVIESGVSSEAAFIMSDLYIRKIEECKTVAEVEELEYEMLRNFIALPAGEDLLENLSSLVKKSFFYIKQNIQHKISREEIADYINVHPNYLSSLFKKETGLSLSEFIDKQKTDAICLFLSETELSITDIAHTFEFSSVAYFSSYFKRIFDMSPSKYRQMHYKHP